MDLSLLLFMKNEDKSSSFLLLNPPSIRLYADGSVVYSKALT